MNTANQSPSDFDKLKYLKQQKTTAVLAYNKQNDIICWRVR